MDSRVSALRCGNDATGTDSANELAGPASPPRWCPAQQERRRECHQQATTDYRQHRRREPRRHPCHQAVRRRSPPRPERGHHDGRQPQGLYSNIFGDVPCSSLSNRTPSRSSRARARRRTSPRSASARRLSLTSPRSAASPPLPPRVSLRRSLTLAPSVLHALPSVPHNARPARVLWFPSSSTRRTQSSTARTVWTSRRPRPSARSRP